ncbi:MAG: DUF3667 domain-containing protein [Gemmatimonadaceae bacterium]
MTVQRAACLNCGSLITGEYCANCGQRDIEPRISVREMAHELAAEHFGLDSKVASTIGTLILHPGRLTCDFFDGRRARYIPPLRLYIWTSVLFFLLFAATRSDSKNRTAVSSMSRVSMITDTAKLDDSVTKQRMQHKVEKALTAGPGDNAVVRYFKQRSLTRMHDAIQDQQSVMHAARESFTHRLPDAIFLLLPLVALILYALYHRSGRYYAEHLVFALHVQSFTFIALTATLLPWSWIAPLVWIWLAVYLFMSMRTVYDEGRTRTGAKFVVLTSSYGLALGAGMTVLAVIVFLFG